MKLLKVCSNALKVTGLIALWATVLYADKGGIPHHCPNSPENPSLILALLGTAGIAWQYARARTRL